MAKSKRKKRKIILSGLKSLASKAGCFYVYVSDSELSDFSDDNGDPCCVCKKRSPPGLKDCLDIVIIKWAQCEHFYSFCLFGCYVLPFLFSAILLCINKRYYYLWFSGI
jgi:hypothetical protein